MGFWDFFGLLLWSFVFVMYLMVLFQILGDLFRDPELGGGAKALWTIGLILVPFLVIVIYLIARGRGMAERQLWCASAGAGRHRTTHQVCRRFVEPDGSDRLGEGAARQRFHHVGRIQPIEGEGARLIVRRRLGHAKT